ncbi:LysR family transcriptional regulator [Xylophilus sp. GW821-FHT01B05]
MDRIVATQVFVAVVDSGSLTAAAERLDMSRAMATRYLAQMERWAGARLLHRSTRRLGLSPAGEELLPRCRELLALAEQMPHPAGEGADGPQGMLRIACAPSLAENWLARAMADYLRQYPRVAVDLVLGNQAVNLVEERIDLAIRISNALDPQLIARRLADCHSVVCAAPSYLAARGTPRRVEDLALHDCLTYTYFGKSLWNFTRAGEPVAVPVGGKLSANDATALLHAAIAGAGICMQPAYAAAPHIAAGTLVALLPEAEPPMLGVHGIYSSRRQMPAALRSLLDFLAARFAADPGWGRYAAPLPLRSETP